MGFSDFLSPLIAYGMSGGGSESEGAEERYDKLIQMSLDENGRLDPTKLRELMAEQQGPSAMEGVSADPRLADAQMSALRRFQDISNQQGMTVEDRGRLNDVEGQANAAATARRQGILAGQRRRGMGGGGSELSAMLSGAANDSNAQSAGSYAVHGDAARRALQALQGQSELASGMRTQDFGEKSKVAGARDRVAEFNTQLRQQAALANQRRDQQVFENQRAVNKDRAGLRTQKGELGLYHGQQATKRGAARGRFIGGLYGGAMDLGMQMNGGGIGQVASLAGGSKNGGGNRSDDDGEGGY